MTSAALHRAAFRAMASDCVITLAYSPQQGRAWAEQQAQRAIHEIRRIEAKYSRYQSDSLVSRINAAAGQSPVPIDRKPGNFLTLPTACTSKAAACLT